MSSPLRIAVADDEPELRRYFTIVLPRLGYEVVAVAENGRELLEQCLVTRPDLIITDYNMPEMDGLEATREIARTFAVAVMLVTGYDDRLSPKAGEAEHVHAQVTKPFKMAQLAASITLATERFADQQAGLPVGPRSTTFPGGECLPREFHVNRMAKDQFNRT